MKKCKKCLLIKQELDFRHFKANNKWYYKGTCKDCERKYSLEYNHKNPERHRQNTKKYLLDHPDYIKTYQQNNKEKITKFRREYESRIYVKVRKRISRAINHKLKGTKKNNSILKFLPYSIEELKIHLESQFEFWMNWNNWGNYIPSTWDDNNSSTWKWQIDHIIPQVNFHVSSMEDEEFQKCWALNNLRPLSAKKNVSRPKKILMVVQEE